MSLTSRDRCFREAEGGIDSPSRGGLLGPRPRVPHEVRGRAGGRGPTGLPEGVEEQDREEEKARRVVREVVRVGGLGGDAPELVEDREAGEGEEHPGPRLRRELAGLLPPEKGEEEEDDDDREEGRLREDDGEERALVDDDPDEVDEDQAREDEP